MWKQPLHSCQPSDTHLSKVRNLGGTSQPLYSFEWFIIVLVPTSQPGSPVGSGFPDTCREQAVCPGPPSSLFTGAERRRERLQETCHDSASAFWLHIVRCIFFLGHVVTVHNIGTPDETAIFSNIIQPHYRFLRTTLIAGEAVSNRSWEHGLRSQTTQGHIPALSFVCFVTLSKLFLTFLCLGFLVL